MNSEAPLECTVTEINVDDKEHFRRLINSVSH